MVNIGSDPQSVLRFTRHLCLRDPLEDFTYEITRSTLVQCKQFSEQDLFRVQVFVCKYKLFRTCVKRTGHHL